MVVCDKSASLYEENQTSSPRRGGEDSFWKFISNKADQPGTGPILGRPNGASLGYLPTTDFAVTKVCHEKSPA